MESRKFVAVVAQYGIANEQGDILTHEAAMKLFDQLRQQESMPLDEPGYYITDTRIEGDEKQGKVYATFAFE